MIYPNEPFYVVSSFQPSSGNNLGRFGFSVGLDPNFAKKAFEKEISEEIYKRFDKMGKSIIALSGFKGKFTQPPYKFVENQKGNLTNLLRWCDVPGDACDLGIDGSELSNLMTREFDDLIKYKSMIEYGPHNVDSPQQAYALLSLWLNWSNHALAICNDKNQ